MGSRKRKCSLTKGKTPSQGGRIGFNRFNGELTPASQSSFNEPGGRPVRRGEKVSIIRGR